MSERAKTINVTGASVLLPVLIIALASFAVYFNTLFYDFVYDDVSQVLNNPWIKDLKYIPDMFSNSVWGFLPVSSVSNYYRPLMHVIYMVTYYIFGLRPWGFHLVNLLFHAGNSVLVFLLADRLLRDKSGRYEAAGVKSAKESGPRFMVHDSRFPAFLAALLFAVHPVHTEAVAWVGAITDLSFTLFCLFSLYYWISYVTDGGRRPYFFSLASFCLALLCKEPAATLPLVLLTYDVSLGKPGRIRLDHVRRYIPFAFILGFYFLARYHALGGFAPVKAHGGSSAYQLLINVIPLFTRYLALLILPVKLNAFHIVHPVSSLFGTEEMLSAAAVAVYALLAAVAFRKNGPAFFGLMLFVVPLLPVFYSPGLGEASLAERYLYLPSVGFVLLFAVALTWIGKNLPRYAALAVLAAIALAGAYSVQTVKRNPVWKDNLTLFSDMVRQSPGGELPRGMLGNALMDRGRLDEAIEQYKVVINQLNPNSAQAHRNLGLALMKKGLKKEALIEFEKAVAIAPTDFEARRALVIAYEDLGLLDDSIREYRSLLLLTPKSAETYYRLGVVLTKKGLTREAASSYKQAIALNPNYAAAHYSLGSIYANSEQLDEAIVHFEAAVRLAPEKAFYRNVLGITYGQKGLPDKAAEQFEEAVRLAPAEPAYRENLERAKRMKNG